MKPETSHWIQLCKDLQSEGALLSSRNQPIILESMYNEGLVSIEIQCNRIVAFSGLFYGSKRWYELGSVWVHKDFRGQKLASLVFFNCMKHIICKEYPIFLITKNLAIIHMAKKHCYTSTSIDTWSKVPIQASCGICEIPQTENARANCPLRAVQDKCFMLYHLPTTD